MKISSILSLSSLSLFGMATLSGNVSTAVAAIDAEDTMTQFSYVRKKNKKNQAVDTITYHATTFLSGVKTDLSDSDIAIFDEISKAAYNSDPSHSLVATKVTVTKATPSPVTRLASLVGNSQLGQDGFTIEGTYEFGCGPTCRDDDASSFVFSDLADKLAMVNEVADTLCAMLKESGVDNFQNVHDCMLSIDDADFVEKKKKKGTKHDTDTIIYHATTVLSGVKTDLSESDIVIFDEISKAAYNSDPSHSLVATKVTVTKATPSLATRLASFLSSLLSPFVGSSQLGQDGFTIEGTYEFGCGPTCRDDDASSFVFSHLADKLAMVNEVADTLCTMLKESGVDNFQNVHDCMLSIDDADLVEKKKKKDKHNTDTIIYHATTFLSGVKTDLSDSDIAIFDEISKAAYNSDPSHSLVATKVTVTKTTPSPVTYLASLVGNSQLGQDGFTIEGTYEFGCGPTCRDDDASSFVFSDLADKLAMVNEVADNLCTMLKESGVDNFQNVHDCMLSIDHVEMEEMAVLEA